MIVAVGTKNPAKLEGVRKAFSKHFQDVEIMSVDSSSVAKAQPHGLDEIVEGAKARARHAIEQGKADFGVGVEAGIFLIGEVYFDHQQAAIVDASGKVSLGHSAGYMLPREPMQQMLRDGSELERWAEKVSGIQEVGDKGGLINFLTNSKMTRSELTEQCVTTALIPWLHRDIYDF